METKQKRARHTPGSWEVTNYGDDKGVYAEKGYRGGDVALVRGTGNNAETTANADLIAAAPDLLEACEDLLAMAHENGFDSWPGDSGYDFRDACDRARDAVRKATGQ